jgi:hypothetical protein
MTTALDELDSAIPDLEWLEVTDRVSGAIMLPRYEAVPEPRNLRRIKAEVQRRWGTVPLIGILKKAVLRTGCLDEVSAVAGSGMLPVEVLAERLMLAIHAYGTNTGIRAVAAGAGTGMSRTRSATSRRRYPTATPPKPLRTGSPTRRSSRVSRRSGVKGRRRWRRTRRTFARTTRTLSPNGIRATAGAGS